MAQGELEAQGAEADAFQGGVSGAAGARGHKSAAPPRFEHGIRAEAGAVGERREAAKKIGESTARKECDRHPERNEAGDGEESEEEIFDDAVAEDIKLCSERSGELPTTRQIAIECVKSDSGNRERQGGPVGPGIATEQGHRAEGQGDARGGDLVGRHGDLLVSFCCGPVARPAPMRRQVGCQGTKSVNLLL